ncbi:hypothetical protein C9994_09065 [Marivirga lumbricoides]|uniref:ComEC family competence protein n=1 Tax=Marivirga lumbricoides TaxID=1046115 RepID=A0A2T4DQG0_9BACT|nr:hypothetical protein C9994_09065 [Marivirga lumbricoides]
MLQTWNRYAFIRFVLFLIPGIISGVFAAEYFSLICWLFCILSIAYLIFQFFRGARFSIPHSVVSGIIAFIVCFSFGFLNTYWQAEKHQSRHLLNIDSEEILAFRATLISAVKPTDKTYGFKADVSQIKLPSGWKKAEGKLLLYLEKDTTTSIFQYGDEVLIRGKLTELTEPSNPEEFNYKRFSGFNRVYHQQYVLQENICLIDRNSGNIIVAASIKTRKFLEKQVEKYIQDARSLAIAKALTLGIKEELDNDLRNAYAAAGAMHVLAVSGLHVGIIFIIVSIVLKKWRYHKKGRFFFALISLLTLWFYAFITGLSPSVLRAATMFSFIILAQTARRRTNIYNTLAASAFVLLCYNPYLIFSVGFQLSYLAVAGIVFFQPKIYHLLQFKYTLADKVWQITCVSIAAQLVTAPLGLLYFHQFPTYFFLSNLVVIPGAVVILNGTLLVLLFSFIPIVASALGFLLDYIIRFVNLLVFGLDIFPGSIIDGVYITTIEAWLIYFLIACMALLIAEKRYFYMKAAFLYTLLLSTSMISRQWANFKEKSFIVYDVKRNSALSLRVGFNQFLSVSDSLSKDPDKLRFHIYPSQLKAGIASFHPDRFQPDTLPLFKKWNNIELAIWQGKTIACLKEQSSSEITLKEKVQVDQLLVSNSSVSNFDEIKRIVHPKKIIVDASNSYFTIQNLKASFEEENIDFYIVDEKGAFELNIN